jgi:hypothetical protein
VNADRLGEAQLTCARLVELDTEAGRRDHLAGVAVCSAHALRMVAGLFGLRLDVLVELLRSIGVESAAGRPCDCEACRTGLGVGGGGVR